MAIVINSMDCKGFTINYNFINAAGFLLDSPVF